MITRATNFSAGPSTIPEAVLQRVQNELLDWGGTGASIMEISHRSQDFMEKILAPARAKLKLLLNIPDNYQILFVTAGTSHQFSMVPMNLLNLKAWDRADYFYTGTWSGKAIKEAQRYGKINVALSTENTQFRKINSSDDFHFDPNASYVHYTPNETIHGFQFHEIPETNGVPLVADMSSEILSRTIDVSKFGLIYAGAQKNIGPAGLVIVIIREDLLGHAHAHTPTMMDYKICADNDSMYNTPATYSWYLAGLVFKWLKAQGGLKAMAKINHLKAKKLYDYIDNSGFYANPVAKNSRSIMNVPFTLADAALDKKFLAESEAAGLLYLAGHRSVGGMRASIYNAVTLEAVDVLINFMQEFAKKNG